MQLTDYATILRRRWWVILVAAFVAAASAYGFSKWQARYDPVYRSEASYLVVPNRYDNGLLIVLRDRMNSFRAMALAPVQLEKISAELQLDRDADWLLRRVAIQPRPEEQIITVQVDYPDPAMAPRIANAIGDNLVALVAARNSSIEGTDKINVVVNQPARPAVLHRPQTRINVLAGAFLGLVLGLLLAFVLEALDDSLKTPADVERFVKLTTLGAIPNTELVRSAK
ncbi:MAG TPA: lipopolysaccharide biosynthesis protein [Roseiflexaceae bacterium]|nr:lipopolysaccharide biosynthesis protein [Roseiflexaceae bacterium]